MTKLVCLIIKNLSTKYYKSLFFFEMGNVMLRIISTEMRLASKLIFFFFSVVFAKWNGTWCNSIHKPTLKIGPLESKAEGVPMQT